MQKKKKLSVGTINWKLLQEFCKVLKDILKRKKPTTIKADLNELKFSHYSQ